MDALLMELGIIFNNIIILDINQLIALGLLSILLIGFQLQSSNTYTYELNGIKKQIIKIRKWPAWLIKSTWLFCAFYFTNLWIATALALICTLALFIFRNSILTFLLWIKPIITEKEIQKLQNSF